jgi:hypothetical protein
LVRLGRGAFSALPFGDDHFSWSIPLGRLVAFADSPRRPSLRPYSCIIIEGPVVVRNTSSARRALGEATRQARQAAELASLPVQHPHACGIDVGDLSHWACVAHTPEGSECVREFPAHTPGLRRLVAPLKHCGVTTVALEATGVYGHVLSLALAEAGFAVVVTSPKFTRQIQGRPKTDRRDCRWIQRLHSHGLLPPSSNPTRPPTRRATTSASAPTSCDSRDSTSSACRRPWN